MICHRSRNRNVSNYSSTFQHHSPPAIMTAPPLGNLRGMYWDPEKNRYFPLSLSKVTKPQPPTPKRKRTWDVNESVEAQRRLRVSGCRHGRGIGGGGGVGGSGNDGRVGRVGNLLSGYERTGQYFLCRCSEEKVTSISVSRPG